MEMNGYLRILAWLPAAAILFFLLVRKSRAREKLAFDIVKMLLRVNLEKLSGNVPAEDYRTLQVLIDRSETHRRFLRGIRRLARDMQRRGIDTAPVRDYVLSLKISRN